MLRDVAARGSWVSTHPDTILKMGTKEILYRTKHLGCGTDTHLYRDMAAFRAEFPALLQSAGPRVLKQNRGNGGQGVWKVEPVSAPAGAASRVRVLEALRGALPEELPLVEVMADHLGRRFSLRAAHQGGRGHLRPVRDQCQLVLRDPRRGPGRGRPPYPRPPPNHKGRLRSVAVYRSSECAFM